MRAVAIAFAFLVVPALASADQFPCSEQGVLDAIAAGGGPHTFACGSPTIIATSAPITIPNNFGSSVILDGEGDLTLDAGGTHSVLLVHPAATAELRNLTITGGYAASGGGGGISNFGSLTLDGCTVSNNSAFVSTFNYGGGGIINSNELILVDTLVTGNSAGSGAGIASWRSGIGGFDPVLSITGSTISDNNAVFAGGGISADGTVTIADSTITLNTDSSGGAGIVVVGPGPGGPGGDLMLTDSTISGNDGGGLYNGGTTEIVRTSITGNTSWGGIINDGTMTIHASTISENFGSFAGGILNSGTLTFTNGTLWGNSGQGAGAIYNGDTGDLTLENATLSGNTVGVGSGGAGALTNEGSAALVTSTIAGNSGSLESLYNATAASLDLSNTLLEGACASSGDAPSSSGGNIESPGNTCGLDPLSDQVSVSTLSLALGPLAYNGGLSLTHSLGAASVAVDAAGSCPPPAFDQRGVVRPQGLGCDTGAFELSTTSVPGLGRGAILILTAALVAMTVVTLARREAALVI